ncbi:MAG: hypothetical protein DRJ07_15260 [Bacteroidetes bacterium]|nr:MAG: hypothetical protein DRJ07_15260 [Bacteroidota bacterium]
MKLKDFIKTLEQNLDKELIFEYAPGKIAGANYHLTEVKNVQFDTTDCGGKTNFWKETHFQIWESPNEIGKTEFMKIDKILSILKKVDGIKLLLLDTELKIEYGNDNSPTSVMPIEEIQIYDDKLIVCLFSEATRCKANDVCGIETEETSCCDTTVCC